MRNFIGYFDNFANVGNPKGNLGDYWHASKLYVANNMRLAPKFKYLYHVVLNINEKANIKTLNNKFKTEINLLARSADLPKYRVQTETVNQYNRKKLIQTGVQYQPVLIEFHDDNAGLTTLLWESYFRYYFADSDSTSKGISGVPDQTAEGFNRFKNGINSAYFNNESFKHRYGLDKSNKIAPFFNSIQIYQLHPQDGRSTWTSYTLINPIIESFEHDQVSQENSDFSINRLQIAYESVQYARGSLQEGIVPQNFGEVDHYDTIPSPIAGAISPIGSNMPIPGSRNNAEDFIRGAAELFINSSNSLTLKENLDKLLLQTGRNVLQDAVTRSVGNINFGSSTANNIARDVITEAVKRIF